MLVKVIINYIFAFYKLFIVFPNTAFKHKKSTVPTESMSAKTVLSVRDQGLEPWTP